MVRFFVETFPRGKRCGTESYCLSNCLFLEEIKKKKCYKTTKPDKITDIRFFALAITRTGIS